jgi:pimeloyl-ACP methyl ester carboxylesterase
MNKITSLLTLFVLLGVSFAAHTGVEIKSIQGAWLGQMQIPNGPQLTVGLEVFKKADGNWGANVSSMDQGNRYISVSDISINETQLTVQLQGAPIKIVGTIDESLKQIDTEFKQGENGFPLLLKSVEQIEDRQRQQTPKLTQDYKIEEISYQNKNDSVWLSGTLTLPTGNDKKPAVMLIAGSGPSHRDAYHYGHRPFMVLADYLTKQGFIVLRSDKRGVYKSTGSFSEGDFENFTKDTQAAVQYLKNHDRVQPNQVYLIGHSEGSMIAAMASLIEPVAGIVSLAGPGMSTLDILLLQDQTEPQAKGASAEDIAVLLDFSKKFYEVVLTENAAETRKSKLQGLYDNLSEQELQIHTKWNERIGTLNVNTASSDSFQEFLKQNPLKSWQQVKVPVFILNGDKDSQVPAKQNVDGLIHALAANSLNVNSEIITGLNHMFQNAKTGSTDEYAEIEETIDLGVIEKIIGWLNQQI